MDDEGQQEGREGEDLAVADPGPPGAREGVPPGQFAPSEPPGGVEGVRVIHQDAGGVVPRQVAQGRRKVPRRGLVAAGEGGGQQVKRYGVPAPKERQKGQEQDHGGQKDPAGGPFAPEGGFGVGDGRVRRFHEAPSFRFGRKGHGTVSV